MIIIANIVKHLKKSISEQTIKKLGIEGIIFKMIILKKQNKTMANILFVGESPNAFTLRSAANQ